MERCRFTQSLPRILAAIGAIMQCEPVCGSDDRLVMRNIERFCAAHDIAVDDRRIWEVSV